ncbi:unnamed protein product [Ceutorhynchus assimilis]|uniref:Luciferin 4-monooxygenase n=1 Tax=Ceutorhynchus assimilis TaxID=467358 RepID=A0A9N9MDK0_9CUCU|nr:unnamed protein product [Ceutorhynchus assimilis]
MGVETIKEDDTYVIQGPEPLEPLSNDTLGTEFLKIFPRLPENAVAIIDAFTNEKIFYTELFQRSLNLAATLRHYGYYDQNTVLSISSENCVDYFTPILASFFNGTIMAPLNHVYTIYELEHTLKISEPKVVFCSEDVAEKFVTLKKNLGFIEVIVILGKSPLSPKYSHLKTEVQTTEQFIQGVLGIKNVDPAVFKLATGDPSKMIAAILCSSGTTGLPKGVALSHRCFDVRLAHSRDPRFSIIMDDENILGLLPFFHSYGFAMVLMALANGRTVISLRKFEENSFLKTIQDFKIHTLFLAPPLAVFLAKTSLLDKYDLSCVNRILCGAAPLCKDVEEEVKRRLRCDNIRQGYGMTETTHAITVVPLDDLRHGSCGKAMSFVQGKVRDPATGKSLGPNQVGEFCWKGPSSMVGYYRNEEATKDIFISDGWLKSGDLGYYDEQGYFYIIDRIKELIKYKGFQVAPAELEAILLTHPEVQDVGVVGLPDELVGERPLAFIVRKVGALVTEDELKKYVADVVSPQKRLTGGVIFVESIPKNQTGKILRRELRNLLKQYEKRLNLDSKL